MFESLQQGFKNFLGRYTYRQRFIFWVLLVFLVVPIPTYWILTTQQFFRSQAKLQLEGIKEANFWLKIFDGVVNNYIEWTCRIASGEGNKNDLTTLKRTISEAIEILKNKTLLSETDISLKTGFFNDGYLIKSHKDNLLFLEQFWDRISDQTQSKNLHTHELVFKQEIAKLSQKIHEIAYDHHLPLQTNKNIQELAEIIYFSFLHHQILLADLNQTIAHLNSQEGSQTEIIDQANIAVNALKGHFEKSKTSLETIYQDLKNYSIWKEFSYEEAQDSLADCYQLNTRLYDKVKANLLALENERQPWPGSNSLFIKNVTCLEKTRGMATVIFEQLLLKEECFYFWQQFLVFLAVLFFIFLMFIFIIFRFLTSHFVQMHEYILGLSKGNFTGKMNVNPKEEIGQIAIAFQKMGISIKEVVDELKALGVGLADSSEKIEITTHEQNNAITIQENSLTNLDANIKKIAANSRELADTMDAFTLLSKERLEKDDSTHGLEYLKSKMNILKIASTNIFEILSNLHEKGLSTRKLTTHMTKISDQASLLALNAAIESLNVGENPSFNTITAKIQNFAETTATTTFAIQKIVNEMSQSIALGKVTTESCTNEISLGANRLIEVSHQLQTITVQDAIQHGKFHHVNTMMQNQAQRSEEIIKSASLLNAIGNKNIDSVNTLYQTITELGIAAQELRELVQLFFSEGTKKTYD